MTALPDIAEATPLWLLLLTTLVGAVEGAGLGRRRGTDVDIIGMAVFAFFLGLGGGLARDALLGLPAAAIQSFWYPTMVVTGLGLVLVLGRWIPLTGSVMVGLDALTLGLYAVIGTQKALDHDVPPIGAVVVGLFAALTGGAVVSLLQQQRPAVITPGAPYAVLALIGVLLYLALVRLDGGLAAFACVGFVVISRFVTLHRGTTTGAVSSLPEP
ncbi:MAG: hypothetical protein QG597_3049 [Actinomycetota bacterium]|nr:hypothetical protein [Actinomycetota bacterium]